MKLDLSIRFNKIWPGLRRLNAIQDDVVDKTEEIADMLKEQANENLQNSLGTGVWGRTRSHGYDQNDNIADSWEEEVAETRGYVKGTLKNTSSHAVYVEVGTTGPIEPKTSKMLKLGPNKYVKSVRGQRGYHYLGRAFSKTSDIKDKYTEVFTELLSEVSS